MADWKRHLMSILAISIFMVLALACEDEFDDEWGCNDAQYKGSQPLQNTTDHSIFYEIKVVDRETNTPLPDMTVSVSAFGYNCEPSVNCPATCYMKVTNIVQHQIGTSNHLGSIIGSSKDWQAKDEKDKVKFTIGVTDNQSGLYSSINKDVNIGYEEQNVKITIPLLKKL